MASATISQTLINLQTRDSDFRASLSAFINDLRDPADTPEKDCRQRQLDELVTKFSELLLQRSDLVALTKTSPEYLTLPELTSKLLASRQATRAYMKQLDDIIRNLNSTIDICNQGLESRKHVPDPRDILSLAHRIRQTSFHGLGINPSEPPCPQLWHMHISAIGTFNAQQEAAASQTHQTADSAQPSSSAPGQLPPLPKGWKPGDPIPPPPKGWKPGDPITFPEDLGTGSSSEEDEDMEEEGGEVYAPATGLTNLGFAYALNPDLDDLDDMEVVSEEESSDDEED